MFPEFPICPDPKSVVVGFEGAVEVEEGLVEAPRFGNGDFYPIGLHITDESFRVVLPPKSGPPDSMGN